MHDLLQPLHHILAAEGENSTDFLGFADVIITLLGFLLTWSAWGLISLKKRKEWESKTFMRQVNVSLNDVRDNTLFLRTVLEDTAENVFLSELAVQRVLTAAQKTTADQPFVKMATPEDQGYVHRAIINAVSSKFADAFIARSLGRGVTTKTFVFGLTFERTENVITQKPRVMLIDEEVLKQHFHPSVEGQPEVIVATHKDRLITLRKMAALYFSEADKDRVLVGTLELGLPS